MLGVRWITEKLTADGNHEAAKTSWPELVGVGGEQAKDAVEKEVSVENCI